MLQNYLFMIGSYWETIPALLAETVNAAFWKEGLLIHFMKKKHCKTDYLKTLASHKIYFHNFFFV